MSLSLRPLRPERTHSGATGFLESYIAWSLLYFCVSIWNESILILEVIPPKSFYCLGDFSIIVRADSIATDKGLEKRYERRITADGNQKKRIF